LRRHQAEFKRKDGNGLVATAGESETEEEAVSTAIKAMERFAAAAVAPVAGE
jgi:hypothetical protein